MVGPRSWISGLFTHSNNRRQGSGKTTTEFEQRWQKLQKRLEVPFDEASQEPQEALEALLHAAFPNIELEGLVSEQWKEMGWQDKPRSPAGINFLRNLEDDEDAFDALYCITFAMMDAQWLAMRASYMEFNEVLQVTRTRLEWEFSLEDVRGIRDLPAHNLL